MKIKYKLYTAILGMGLLFSACTDGFENINKEYLPDLDPAESDLVFALKSGSTYAGAHLHQRIKNINIDCFSQYFENGAINRTWAPNDGYNIDYWSDHYRWLLHANSSIEGTKDSPEKINLNSVARIWRTYMQSQFLDFFGPAPMPTTKGENSAYIELKDQYTFFFKELSEASAAINTDKGFVSKSTQDIIFQGDLGKWQRFANSLHLRLAIKLSEIDPTLCAQEVTNAAKAKGGLMIANSDNAKGPIMSNGLWGQQYNYFMYQQSWGSKEVMTTTMEKIFTNLGGIAFNEEAKKAPAKLDPRGTKYFAPSVKGLWQGIPPGLNASETATDKPLLDSMAVDYAYLSPVWIVKNNTKPIDLLMYTEVCFLMAEANERGFVASGSAEEWYNKGVTASMEAWGVAAADITTYLKSADKNGWGTSAAYGDAAGNGNTKLEKIITQKYIANFPDVALEAWNDKRRLNLPAFVTPRYTSPAAGTYPLDKNIQNPNNFISRMAYPQQEVFVNKDKYEAGVALLGAGGDKTSTPLWWASKRSNYCTSNVN
ncbi:SusD-like starch-binding protein associating with outer membrane [Dysgonomonas alginatilytica]|uniref:SusD-like starch-binding protein associating with outer membrane n=1 Tax=Dysgonomonas alginatilytica TaxID=1605892 RepID=A0A2V3PPV6_9BACT|nr:SusD/RagB family nutrient-binding outer membrane lipoprotein [Dysgonomonas alginatilytica]PXV65423.1 SusD-like starch-binding protein associating with outer membrane [Dysgonomonas alginatilytica]